jgi:competence protein ComEC
LVIIGCSLAVSAFAQDSQLTIHFIGVGEGEAIFVQTPQRDNVLIDTGNLLGGPDLLNYLREQSVDRLDNLVLTHPHLDHIGGVFFILPMLGSDKVYDNGHSLNSKTDDTLRQYVQLVRKHKNYEVLNASDSFRVGEVSFKVLSPQEEVVSPSDFNTNSLVIMMQYKTFRCLLMADATLLTEKDLLKQGLDLKVSLLKVGHHGSDDASGDEFLKAVSPAVAIISVDTDNLYGYPSDIVLQRLESQGIEVYRTDLQGNIVVRVDESGNSRIDIQK